MLDTLETKVDVDLLLISLKHPNIWSTEQRCPVKGLVEAPSKTLGDLVLQVRNLRQHCTLTQVISLQSIIYCISLGPRVGQSREI